MRVDTDDFARPRGCGKNHLVEVEKILIEPGAVNALEEAMSEGFLKEYISPLLICDTNTCKATEEIMEDIYDKIPFVSVPTAASGDGFVSTTAVMTFNGIEEEVPAAVPVALYADTDIFAKAPAGLNAAGAAELSDEKISLSLIEEGNPEACEKLMYALIKSGFSGQAEGE